MSFFVKRSLITVFLACFWVFSNGQGCTKVIVYGKNYDTDPRTFTFSNSHDDVIVSIKKTLDRYGYQIHSADDEKGHFVTGWKPTEAESHYFDLFGRKDYGVADGAYYQLVVDVIPQSTYQKVLIATTVKTIAGKLQSSGKLENKLFNQIKDYLQASQIEITNVDVGKKQ